MNLVLNRAKKIALITILGAALLLTSQVLAESEPTAGAAAQFAGIDFVWCPPGAFNMGAKDTTGVLAERFGGIEEWYAQERPQLPVDIKKGFWISKNEISKEQWVRILSMIPPDGSTTEGEGPPMPSDSDNALPMSGASWNDAQLFLKAINAMNEGVFRLPKEAEWEYACRAGTQSDFFFEGSAETLKEYAWWAGPSRASGEDSPQPGGALKPNPWGLFDMLGNVWEWCDDPYQHYSPPAKPSEEVAAFNRYRVVRGGAFSSTIQDVRVSSRRSIRAELRHPSVGLRLVRDP